MSQDGWTRRPGIRAIAYGGVGGNEYSVDGTSTNANSRSNGFNPVPELVEAVKRARAHGRSWNRIAVALGVSRQAARQRFGHID